MHTMVFAVALVALLICAFPSLAAGFFVAPDGNDAWSGTFAAPNAARTDGPFATPHRAQEAVRDALRANPGKPVTVTLRAGTYFLPEPITMGPEDSGSPGNPVRWQAAEGEKVVLSSGRPITGEWSTEDGRIYSTTVPGVADGDWYFRLLRVGDDWATRARYPNADPENPYTGGFLFAKPSRRAKGQFGSAVANIHNRGDFMEWEVDIPATGDYNVFHYYGAHNQPFGRDDMGGRVSFTVDDGEPVLLRNLQDTGGWQSWKWSARNATLHLEAGKRRIRWTNVEGGGLNYDAFVLCDDPDWTPAGTPPVPPAEGFHMIVVHGETFVKSQGRELSVNLPASRRDFGFDPGELKEWSRPDEIEMHVFPAWGWVSSIEAIAEINLEEGVVSFGERDAAQEIRPGNHYFLENIPEELDSPGEWYLDRETGTLRYWPQSADFREKEIVAPVSDRIIHIKGAAGEGDSAGNIELIGLTFMDTAYSPTIESPYYPPDAAIWIEDATGCLIENCAFTRVGGSALNLKGDARGNRFLGNLVEYVGQNGVFMVGGEGDMPFPHSNTVAGCTMRHIGLIYKHVAGVYIGRRDPALTSEPGNLIAHNLITDCPRYAIGIKMNQGNNVVEFNEIHRTNMETNDTGGIESCVRNREAPGNIYRYNLVTDAVGLKAMPDGTFLTPYYSWGIYMDDHSSSAHIVGNICVRNYRGGVHIHGGQKNIIENNILVDSTEQQCEFNNIGTQMVENVFRRNIVYRLKPGGNMIRAGGWNDNVLAECDHNLYWSAAAEPVVSFLGMGLDAWREKGYDTHSVVADPLFVDPAKDDYRLQPGSPAFALGFEAIPVEKIGLAGYERGKY